ncbi:DUF3592 domain-containing protein [Embleya sp. NPDC001921]
MRRNLDRPGGRPASGGSEVPGIGMACVFFPVVVGLLVLLLWGLYYGFTRSPTAFGGGLLVLCSLSGVARVVLQLRLLRRGVAVPGVVTRVDRRWMDGEAGGYWVYTSHVRFSVPGSEERTVKGPASEHTRVGDPGAVHYDPRKPSRAAVRETRGGLAGLIVFVALFVAATVRYVLWAVGGGRWSP